MNGFSQNTCAPASRPSRASAKCESGGVATARMSGRVFSSISSAEAKSGNAKPPDGGAGSYPPITSRSVIFEMAGRWILRAALPRPARAMVLFMGSTNVRYSKGFRRTNEKRSSAMNIGVDASCWTNQRGFGRYTRELLSALLDLDRDNQYVFLIDE